MSSEYKYIGGNVRRIRQSQGLTIQQLSELANISEGFLGVAERGTSSFSNETIIKLAKALNVSTDLLLFENPPDQETATKIDTLVDMLTHCNTADIDYLISFVNLSKKRGLFKKSEN